MSFFTRVVVVLSVMGFAAGSGCGGNPEVAFKGKGANGAGATDSVGGEGTGATLSLGGGDVGTGCPSTCEALDADCGFVTDTLCGGVVECGKTCPKGEVCGGGGASKCGKGSTGGGGNTCTPSTCEELNSDCGYTTDTKCGGVVQCGASCPKGEVCGGKAPNLCGEGMGGGGSCEVDPATTCEGRGYTCGQAADNCGNLLDCGSTVCPNPGDSCLQGTCQSTACVVDAKTTCEGRGYTCGQAADNCGNLLTCGPISCTTPGWTCGGGSDAQGKPVPGVCGCTGACSQIPECPVGKTTTVTGKVFDPAGKNPLYHVLVYIANNPADPALKAFPKGVTCDVCGASAAGSPLVSDPTVTDPPAGTYTNVDGTFTLKNVPVAKGLTLVIQLGRWRRTFPIDVNTSCGDNPMPSLLMPSTQAQGNIPLMAMVTGKADSLECVLRKMGIASTEFTDPAKGGRVQFYLGNGDPGQSIDAQTPDQTALFVNGANNQPVIQDYDMAILSCQGAEYDMAPNLAKLRNYADAGGRVFTTHYSYSWLTKNDAMPGAAAGTYDNWSEVAKWHVDENDRSDGSAIGTIDHVTNPKADAFQGWLEAVGASVKNSNQATVVVIRHDTDGISAKPGQTQQWLYRDGTNARQCGVSGDTCTSDAACGKTCSVRTQKVCTTNADCSAKVCQGQTQNACNGNNDCQIGGRNRGPCVANTCVPDTCQGTDYTGTKIPLHFTFNTPVNLVQDLTKTPPAVQCGRVLFSDFHVQNADENGKTYPEQCGKTCTTAADCTGTCGGNKLCPWGSACTTNADCASQCSPDGRCLDPMNAQEKLLEYMIFDLGSCVPPPVACVPSGACPAGQDCGYAPDGCGGLVACGKCPKGTSCGVGNPPVANHCGSVTCTPATECPPALECGFASDGCSGVVDCGTCPQGQVCTGGKCGSGKCTPHSCDQQGIQCGEAGDQCGGKLTCAPCLDGSACVDGMCVPQGCVPLSCTDQAVECGPAADGCGNMIASCGMCAASQLCVAGKCKQIK